MALTSSLALVAEVAREEIAGHQMEYMHNAHVHAGTNVMNLYKETIN